MVDASSVSVPARSVANEPRGLATVRQPGRLAQVKTARTAADSSREARAGLLLAFWGIAQKGADALGVVIGLGILSLFGFNPNGANDATAILGLKIAYIALPVTFGLLSAAFVWNFPLTPARQRRIRAILGRRAAREAATLA